MRRRDLIKRVGRRRGRPSPGRGAEPEGGVGKTTTGGTRATLATLRGDRVIAVDANPTRHAVGQGPAGDGRDDQGLLTSATRSAAPRLRAFTSQAPSRLEVLARPRPGVVRGVRWPTTTASIQVLEQFLLDLHHRLRHRPAALAMSGVLGWRPDHPGQLAVGGRPRSASATLDWLEAHTVADLVRERGGGDLGSARRARAPVDLDGSSTTSPRAAGVARIPYDRTWRRGGDELECSPATPPRPTGPRRAVGDGLAWPAPLTSRSG